jgi:hypothetical protein
MVKGHYPDSCIAAATCPCSRFQDCVVTLPDHIPDQSARGSCRCVGRKDMLPPNNGHHCSQVQLHPVLGAPGLQPCSVVVYYRVEYMACHCRSTHIWTGGEATISAMQHHASGWPIHDWAPNTFRWLGLLDQEQEKKYCPKKHRKRNFTVITSRVQLIMQIACLLQT